MPQLLSISGATSEAIPQVAGAPHQILVPAKVANLQFVQLSECYAVLWLQVHACLQRMHACVLFDSNDGSRPCQYVWMRPSAISISSGFCVHALAVACDCCLV